MNGEMNILDKILKNGQKIYCKTQAEVEYFKDVAYAKGLRWVNGDDIREHFDGCPIMYELDEDRALSPNKVSFSLHPSARDIKNAIQASELRNYAISIRNKRS